MGNSDSLYGISLFELQECSCSQEGNCVYFEHCWVTRIFWIAQQVCSHFIADAFQMQRAECVGVGAIRAACDPLVLVCNGRSVMRGAIFFKLFIRNQNYFRFYKLICCDSIYDLKRLIQWEVLVNLFLGRLALFHLRLMGSLSVASYDSQGLRRKHSYPPPQGVDTE
jgi:hypothetical protein